MIPLMRSVAMTILIPQMTPAPPSSIPPMGCPKTAQSRKQPNGIAKYIITCTIPTVLNSIDFAILACWAKATQARPKVARYNYQL